MKRILCSLIAFGILYMPLDCLALDVSARSAIVIDAAYGNVIFEKNSQSKMTMASTTKIMTALCAIESGELDKKVKVADSAVGIEGSSMYLKKGEELTLRELVYGLMLSSGNDAAVAIAYAVSGSKEKFASLMNDTAKKIGALNTQFKNPNGLDEEGHYTTAYDLAKITAYAMKNKEFRKIVSTYQSVVGEGEGKRYLTNHNKLLRMMDGCTGVKTGFTKKSGRCLVSACSRNGVEVVCVTLNAPDDWRDHMAMTDFALGKIQRRAVLEKGEILGTTEIKNGVLSEVFAVSPDDFILPAVDGTKYVSVCRLKDSVKAPVKKGDKIGSVQIYMEDSLIETLPLVAEQNVAKEKTLLDNFVIVAKGFLN